MIKRYRSQVYSFKNKEKVTKLQKALEQFKKLRQLHNLKHNNKDSLYYNIMNLEPVNLIANFDSSCEREIKVPKRRFDHIYLLVYL